MKTNKGWALLCCVSVAFNIFFVAGYLRARSYAAHSWTFEDRARWVSERLNLDTDQQEHFDRLLEETVEKRTQLFQEKMPWKKQLMDELVKDQPDPAILKAFVEQDHRKEHRGLMVQQTRKLMAALRPQQRQALRQMLEDRWERKFGRHR